MKNLEICDCTFVVNFLAICILPWNISLEIFQNSQNYLLAEHFRVTSDYAQSDLQNYSCTNTEPLNTFWKVKPFFKPWRYFFKSLESTTKLFFPLLIYFKIWILHISYSMDAWSNLNVYKTLRGRLGHLRNVLCTSLYVLCPGSKNAPYHRLSFVPSPIQRKIRSVLFHALLGIAKFCNALNVSMAFTMFPSYHLQ